MEPIKLKLKMAIEKDGKQFSQKQAGGMPFETSEIKVIELDGHTEYEILHKLIINTMGVFVTALQGTDDILLEQWKEKILKYRQNFIDVLGFDPTKNKT